jgi:hypothetical protein
MGDGAWAAIGGAGVGGVFTYAAARLQGASESRRLEAENRRLADDRAETERQHRQETYHKLLASLDELRLLATGVGRPPATEESWGKWVSEFNYLLDGVRLFGGQSVVDAAEALYGMTFRLNDELTKQLRAGSDYGNGLFQALLVLDDDLNIARKAIIDAMRADVALRA